jgi:hypothetical protein
VVHYAHLTLTQLLPMAISNHERVGRALNLLRDGLYPYLEREMKAIHGDRWLIPASSSLPDSY